MLQERLDSAFSLPYFLWSGIIFRIAITADLSVTLNLSSRRKAEGILELWFPAHTPTVWLRRWNVLLGMS